jgi:3-oxoacyl-[acyl-carrier protein] reductase
MDCGVNLMLTGTKPGEIEQLNIEEKNPKIKWINADFSSPGGIDSFIDELKGMDNIDICVNNAGINIIKPYEKCSADEYQRLMSINLTAPFSLTQQLIPGMKKRGFGRIVNIASIWSEISKPGRSLYTTSKTGLVGLTRSLAVEHASSNILINAVSPGFTCTELTEESLSADEIKTLSEQIPIGRFAEPNEIAQTVLFLCSDLNTYITGQNIVVDGGFTLV